MLSDPGHTLGVDSFYQIATALDPVCSEVCMLMEGRLVQGAGRGASYSSQPRPSPAAQANRGHWKLPAAYQVPQDLL